MSFGSVNMETERKIAIAACIALLIILLVNTPFTCSQTKVNNATYMVFSKDIAFKLPAYNTMICFSEDYKFTKFEWDQWNATMIYFYNLQMDGDEVPKFGIGVKNANATIVDLFVDQRLSVVLEGPTGVTGTTVIYCPYDPIMIFEDGELKTSDYTWNPDTKLLTVNVTFSSPVELDVYFAVPRVESHKVEGEFLGYVFPGTQTVKLSLQLYSEGSQVSQDTRIILEVYNMDGALIYTTAKRETLTQGTKTVAFNIPDLEPGTYLIKVTLQNPDTGETLNTYSFLLKVTYPWWLWLTAIIAVIGIATVIMYKKKHETFSLKERLQHVA